MDYLEYFKLNAEPFSNAPVSRRFYFDNAVHSRAMFRMKHAVETGKGLTLIIGDIGTGKTTLARKLLEELPDAQYEAALLVIIHSAASPDWLMRRMAQQLGVENPAHNKLDLVGQIYQRLLKIHEEGRQAVVLVDEAQMLQTREVMEEFRGLLNLETESRKLVSFIFFGLPELESVLKLDPPLEQRVQMKYRLATLDQDATLQYIAHRLREAGGTPDLFTKEATEEIFRYSRGIPRMINTLCDNCLFDAYITRRKSIDVDTVTGIAIDLGLKSLADASARPVRQEMAPPPSTKPEDDIDAMLDSSLKNE